MFYWVEEVGKVPAIRRWTTKPLPVGKLFFGRPTPALKAETGQSALFTCSVTRTADVHLPGIKSRHENSSALV